ncbi:hypothetical protein [Pleionea litopenaei]|uniref:Uncharacterized protein n=1 Tax=Pleionea litopenaei TaxID=3070815 RepID=A0AA51RR69_9GAMM|nr:hypothetical protein [Pleionea sp. HL-JVS1]WMS86121.1 hypothetical protein Q9312_12920 [Pleionea sp. HL-JVS1]
MLYLIVGIVLGAAFHEFWTELFCSVKNKITQWTQSEQPQAPSAEQKAEAHEAEVVSETPQTEAKPS